MAKERRANQPLDRPNTGSVFKNPPGNFAAKLIDEAGLKGTKEGDAEISSKHANFIVNHGNATTADAVRLMEKMESEVLKKSGVKLEREVHVIEEVEE